jgi:hypothetical protein
MGSLIPHYFSPRQYKRYETFRNINLKLNSKLVINCSSSRNKRLQFPIHYEIEDGLQPAWRRCDQYPKAKVSGAISVIPQTPTVPKNTAPAMSASLSKNIPTLFDLASATRIRLSRQRGAMPGLG